MQLFPELLNLLAYIILSAGQLKEAY